MGVHFRTEDFMLRDFAVGDAPALVRALNDLDVTRWLALVPHPYTEADAAEFLSRPPAAWPEGAAIDVNGSLVGAVGIAPHLGYWLVPAFWGRRIMSRAARAVVGAWFRAGLGDRLVSGAFAGNDRSLKLLDGLGFRETGHSRRLSRATGARQSHVDLELTRAKWERSR